MIPVRDRTIPCARTPCMLRPVSWWSKVNATPPSALPAEPHREASRTVAFFTPNYAEASRRSAGFREESGTAFGCASRRSHVKQPQESSKCAAPHMQDRPAGIGCAVVPASLARRCCVERQRLAARGKM